VYGSLASLLSNAGIELAWLSLLVPIFKIRRNPVFALCALLMFTRGCGAGFYISGLGTGESPAEREEMISAATEALPDSKLRMAGGLGGPDDILEAVSLGVDLLDSRYSFLPGYIACWSLQDPHEVPAPCCLPCYAQMCSTNTGETRTWSCQILIPCVGLLARHASIQHTQPRNAPATYSRSIPGISIAVINPL
jgi:hypothetical protein